MRKTQTVFRLIFFIFVLAFLFFSALEAYQDRESESIQPRSILGDGIYNNDVRLLIDGKSPPEGSPWNTENGIFWNDTDAFFVVDLGGLFEITGILVQVDGNDDYGIDYSEDGNAYFPLVRIRGAFGGSESGMKTLSTVNGDQHYIEELGFDPVTARFVKFYATGGDSQYSVSEIQIFGYHEDSKEGAAAGDEGRVIRPAGIQASGNFSNSAGLIVDGRIPFEGGDWNSAECVFWEEIDTFFVIDLGDVYEITGIVVQVDSGDDYRIEYSVSGDDYVPLVEILGTDGEVESGMDTMSSLPDHPEFVSDLEFLPVRTRFIKIFASDGNNEYAISEVQLYGFLRRD
ncbi:MAG: discoidin domain-containing protein [Candidatus Aminicenantes bacterium]|nr:discoidin domain-containing protein [Candidatus Aminicenantes bacterium]